MSNHVSSLARTSGKVGEASTISYRDVIDQLLVALDFRRGRQGPGCPGTQMGKMDGKGALRVLLMLTVWKDQKAESNGKRRTSSQSEDKLTCVIPVRPVQKSDSLGLQVGRT